MPDQKKPSILYHYTTAEGLIGILEKRELWAAGVFFMNDAKEFAWGLERACEELLRRADCCNNEEEGKRLRWLERQVRHIGPRSFKTSYAAALSANGDLLSQWRAYCPSGGYSIGFSAEALASTCDSQQFTLAQCIYDDDLQRERIEHVIAASASAWVNSTKPEPWNLQEGDRFAVAANLNWELYRVAPTIKHLAFSEEEEWRLLSMPELKGDDVRFRSRRGLVVPYVPIHLGEDRDLWRHVRVVAGPGPHPELARAGAESLVRRTTGFRVPVQESVVPYRHW